MKMRWLLLVLLSVVPAWAYAQLASLVSSAKEGNMEGVLVSAKKEVTSKTVTVVTDAQGRYQFPADRLHAGKHTLTIRAVGYDLAKGAVVDVAIDENEEAWTESMLNDRVVRLNTKSGEFVEYLLLRTNFWIGSNHRASIIRLEPLD